MEKNFIKTSKLEKYVKTRTVEKAIQELHSEIGDLKKLQESIASKAVRRHQFLLMGVKHG